MDLLLASLRVASRASLAVAPIVLMLGCASEADTPETDGTPSNPGGEIGEVGDDGDDDGKGAIDGPLVPADESAAGTNASFADGATAVTTADLNLRSGAGTEFSVLAVIPSGSTVTIVNATPKNNFLNIKWNGQTGWGHSSYLETAPPSGGGTGDIDGAPSPDNALARARASKGFSYWWGGGAWLASGATSSTKGSCSGSCPSCTHSGKYGADCSGLVAKAWQFGTKALEVNSHPYSTADFNRNIAGKWSTVSRGAMKKGDALVYHTSGAGHIVVYEKGDGWGSPTVYECRGCSYGCVYNTRSFGSNYHAIRRAGF